MADIEYLDAYVAISQVKAKYCRTLDAKDWEAFSDLFTEDFEWQGPGVEPVRGRDKVMAYIQASVSTARTCHQVHLPEIELNGDEANVVWAMQDRNTWDPPNRGMTTQRGFGQYHERYRRENGRWKIAAQTLTYFHLDVNFL